MPVTAATQQQGPASGPRRQQPASSAAPSRHAQTADVDQAPQWMQNLMDAADSGDHEFRMEVRKAIEEGRGRELIATLEAMREHAEDDKAKEQLSELLSCVQRWVEDPSELDKGGRFFGGLLAGAGLGGMFRRNYYAPAYTTTYTSSYYGYSYGYPAYGCGYAPMYCW